MTSLNEHERARLLLEERALGIIGDADAGWLASHLSECAECERAAEELKSAIALLRSDPVTAPTFLVSRTRTNVRIRARELQENAERNRLLGLSILLALVWTGGFLYAGYAAYAAWGLSLGMRTGAGALIWGLGITWLWVAPALLVVLLLMRGNTGWLRSLRSAGFAESELGHE